MATNTMLDIQLHKNINTYNYSTTFIAILLSRIKKKSLFDELNNYIPILSKYKDILSHIEKNIIENELNGASITIQLPKVKKLVCKSSHKKTKKYIDTLNLHQLYIVIINDVNKNNIELMDLARNCGYQIYMAMKTNVIKDMNLVDTVCEFNFINCIMEGLLLSAYNFSKYKTIKDKKEFNIGTIHIVSTECDHMNNSSILNKKNKINNLLDEIHSVYLARDLINEPANQNKSKMVIDVIKQEIQKYKLPITIEILEQDKLREENLNLLLGVGQGSNEMNKPKLILLKYHGNKLKNPEYVLIGKGITYDTGGLDLKREMLGMKTDLSGAVTVMAFLLGYAKMKGNKNIYTVCPFAENSIGPDSIKAGDVIKSHSGKTVEITDTDAEGRLILADTISWCSTKWENAQYIDFATLTGQQEKLSCKVFSNVMGSNSDYVIKKLINDGEKINESLVYIPLFENKFIGKLESKVADIKNVSSSCNADMILAAVFIKQFIKNTIKWIHIDFAGPIYKLNNNDTNKYMIGEASGIGVRLLFEFFDNL